MAFTYTQLKQGQPVPQAKENALSYVQSLAKNQKLDQLIVFRGKEETPMDLYLLGLLSEIKLEHNYIKEQTLRDFYTHTMIKLNNFILKGYLIPGSLFQIKLRNAAQEEIKMLGNKHTLEVHPILDNGNILELVQELYTVQLSDNALKTLIANATIGFEMGRYYL